MIPPKIKIQRLLDLLAPVAPGGSVKEVLRTALGPLQKLTAPAVGSAEDERFTCFARPGVLPNLSALLGRRPPPSPRKTERSFGAGTVTALGARTKGGTLAYKLFEPLGDTPPTALVIMLHGCTQDADDFMAGTQMNAVAQANNLLVAYPEQPRGANMSRCWNWFLPDNQKRGQGEAGAIAAVAQSVMASHGIAPGHILVAGLSAGGAMAAIMAETYSDLFGAVGIHSGLPHGAANSTGSAFAAMRGSGLIAPDETGCLGAGVPTIVFHGDADATVDPRNADAIIARLAARETGLSPETETGAAASGRSYLKTTGRDKNGRVRFESWTVKGAVHAWSGGSAAGTYTDPSGPDASAEMVRFFLAQIATAPAR